jgi:murein DD-endopeptidase MepM/ murein hydrolase activator NlpD
MKKIIIAILVFMMFSTFVFSEDEDALWGAQQEKINIDRSINDLTSKKQQEMKKQTTLKEEIEFLQAAKGRESEEYKAALDEYEKMAEGLDDINLSIQEAEDEYNRNMEVLGKRLRALYANADDFVLGSIIESDSLMEFFEKIEFMAILAENDKRLLEKVKMSSNDLKYKRDLQLEQKEDMEASIKEMQNRIENLEATKEDVETKISISKEQYKALDRKEDQLLELSREIVNEIRELQKNSKYAGGGMLWPVPSNRTLGTRLFGMKFHPILKKWKQHNGIDIGAKRGASIIAANTGTVIYSGWRGGYGYCLIIDHGGGIATLYAHCSKLLVQKGQGVEKGQTIAKIGSTGQSTGPHLHFEVREEGSPVDPLLYVGPDD